MTFSGGMTQLACLSIVYLSSSIVMVSPQTVSIVLPSGTFRHTGRCECINLRRYSDVASHLFAENPS